MAQSAAAVNGKTPVVSVNRRGVAVPEALGNAGFWWAR
jgi:hypothetical protein